MYVCMYLTVKLVTAIPIDICPSVRPSGVELSYHCIRIMFKKSLFFNAVFVLLLGSVVVQSLVWYSGCQEIAFKPQQEM